jgi:hypothetical protein
MTTITKTEQAVLSKLPGRMGRMLKALSQNTETTKTIIEEAEAIELAERRILAKELAAIAENTDYITPGDETACEEAARALDRAELGVIAKRAALVAARAAASVAPSRRGVRMFQLKRHLLASADPRLHDLAEHTEAVSERLKLHVSYHPLPRGNWGEHGERYTTNAGEIAAARAQLGRIVAEVKQAQLQALTWDEITVALEKWIQSAARALKPFDLAHLAPMRLTDEGEVQAPARPEPEAQTTRKAVRHA